MGKSTRFNVTGWTSDEVAELDTAVEKAGGGKAHGTRASRGSVLKKAFKGYQAPRKASQETHERWPEFLELWAWWKDRFADWSQRNDSRQEAWREWVKIPDAELPDWPVLLNELSRQVDNAGEPRFVKHLCRLIKQRPWKDVEPTPHPSPELLHTEEDLSRKIRRQFHLLAGKLPDWGELDNVRLALQKSSALVSPDDVILFAQLLPDLEADVLLRCKARARSEAGAELRARHLAAVRQRIVAEEVHAEPFDTWEELLEVARVDQAVRSLAGREFVKVLREVYHVPELKLEDPDAL